MFLYSEFNMDF